MRKRLLLPLLLSGVMNAVMAQPTVGSMFKQQGDCGTYGYYAVLSPDEAMLMRMEQSQDCKDVVVPDSVSVSVDSVDYTLAVVCIGSTAFENYTCLERVSLPAGVWKIDSCAFAGCPALKRVDLPDSLSYIGAGAFMGCSSLEEVSLPTTVRRIGSSAFSRCSSLSRVVLPDSLTRIEAGTFTDCSSLKEIVLPPAVRSVGSYAFSGCSSLETVSLPESITEISDGLFENCVALRSVDVPESVTAVGVMAFSECASLQELELPAGVSSIGMYAFSHCYSLRRFGIAAVLPPSIGDVQGGGGYVVPCFEYYYYDGVSIDGGDVSPVGELHPTTLYVPGEAMSAYRGTYQWGTGTYQNDYKYPDRMHCWFFIDIEPLGGGLDRGDVFVNELGVYASDGVIYLENAEGSAVEVYDVMGRRLYAGYGSVVSVPLPGVYIVCCGGMRSKIAVP